ncbi:MAG: DUF465 domain-containing protein [Magnetococcus sp. WYHC-3]
MFEDQLEAVHELLESNPEFRQLHEEHASLKEKIAHASPSEQAGFAVERWKKEKLLLKDRMANMLHQHTVLKG